MGQPAVDLPDPLEAAGAETAQNADDLLAQLAGDEIDRLLAEADSEATGAAWPGPASAPNEPDPADPLPADAQAVDALSIDPQAVDPQAADPQAADAQVTGLAPQVALEPAAADHAPLPTNSFRQSTAPAGFAVEAADQAAPPDELVDLEPAPSAAAALGAELDEAEADALIRGTGPMSAAPIGTVPAGEGEADDPQVLVADRAELDGGGPDAGVVDENGEPVSLPEVLDEVLSNPEGETDAAPPLLLRPLYWMNKPFENLSDQTRSLLGKIAIVTLLNAVAVLCYVLYLRK